jgi:hypothetical protein
MWRGIAFLLVASAFAGAADAHTATAAPERPRLVVATGDGLALYNADGTGGWGLRWTRLGQRHPSWSPDGRRLVVSDATWPGAGEQLYTMAPDGSNVLQLTHVADARDPAWSPTGTQIAYDDGATVFVVGVDGVSPQAIGPGTDPAWSPDGRSLVLVRERRLVVVDVKTLAARRVTDDVSTLWAEAQPAWSRNGTIVFAGYPTGGASGLFTVPAAGGTPTRLTMAGETSPAWSPDGATIAALRGRDLWTMRADGSDAAPLATNMYEPSGVAWQPLQASGTGCTITGTDVDDLLVGTPNADVICGMLGDDSIIGLGGDDVIFGGDGNDWIAGGLGYDVLVGGDGNDRIDARDGTLDTVDAGRGYDTALVDLHRLDIVRAGAERIVANGNLAVWREVTASREEATSPAVLAVDSRYDASWNAGEYPAQWLEVDLGAPTTVGRIRLITPDEPSDATILILGRTTASAPFALLKQLRGPFAFMQAATLRPKHPWRRIRFVRIAIAGGGGSLPWASWPELEVYER